MMIFKFQPKNSGIAICLCPKSYFLDFSMVVLFSVWENTWIEIFFIKFESNIEKFEAEGRELFNITREFNEKNRNPSVFPDGKQHPQGKSRK